MRKIILCIILFFICCQTIVFADVLSIIPQGNTIINGNSVMQTYLITLNNSCDLSITAQSNLVINEFNPKIQIPLNKVFVLTQNDTIPLYLNKTSRIMNNDTMSFPVTFKLDNIGELEEGICSFNVLFNNFAFNPKFTIPNIQKLSANTLTSNIKIKGKDVFDTNKEHTNVLDSQINIKSNSRWELFLDTFNLGQLCGDYYFQTIGASGENIHLTTNNKIKLEPSKSYLIASGENTSSSVVNIKYSLKNNGEGCLRTGTFYNNLTYRIEKK